MEKREKLFLFNVLNQEVIFEEFFCNLLHIDDFRKLFLKFISSKNSILNEYDVKYENFYTEVTLDNKCGRADLFLKIDNKEFIFEIKHRDWTSLTVNQPNGYLEYLSKDNTNYKNHNGHLFFLIPKSYRHLDEIYKQWNHFDNINNQIFYWQDFIVEIKKSKLYEDSVEIDMFYQFCLYWFNMKNVSFSEEEKQLLNSKEIQMNDFNNKSIPTLMKKLEKIVGDIGSNMHMKKCNECVETGLNYFVQVGDYEVYFGIDYYIWENKDIPLSITIFDYSNKGRFELKLKNIKVEEIEYPETSLRDKTFGYIIILDEEVGSENYQYSVTDTLSKLFRFLNSAH